MTHFSAAYEWNLWRSAYGPLNWVTRNSTEFVNGIPVEEILRTRLKITSSSSTTILAFLRWRLTKKLNECWEKKSDDDKFEIQQMFFTCQWLSLAENIYKNFTENR